MNNPTPLAPRNPLTPLVFLPPDVARQVTIALFIMVSALTVRPGWYVDKYSDSANWDKIIQVMLWDMMNSVSSDLRMLKSGLSVPLAAYFLSR